ncbi:cupredoxin domain-containing protein [Caballeronia sp.]|uniref:cupredoxin domain-containing protein n=1 Tax=Caballeronia sp. TaxID=1931223 RepID=UPI003C56AC5D
MNTRMKGRNPGMLALLTCAILLASGPCAYATDAPSATVVIDNFAFNPPKLSIKAGTTVRWENHDDMPHLVTSDTTPREFASRPLDSGDSFSQTFAKPGTYRYFCSMHPRMTGVVIVK